MPPPTTVPADVRTTIYRPGSFGWALEASLSRLRDWTRVGRPAWSFLIAATVVIFLLRVLQLPGGVLPALPVLLITAVPHSFRLLGLRLSAAAVSTIVASVPAASLGEQPWFLATIAAAICFVACYLLARGLDLLSFLLVMALPILYAWDAANGVDALDVGWTALQVVAIGITVSEFTGMILTPRSSRRTLLKDLAGSIRKIPLSYREGGRATWTVALFSTHRKLLLGVADEIGDGVEMRNLETAASSVRFLLAFHDDIRISEDSFGGIESLPGELGEVERRFRIAVTEETDLLADSFERDVAPAPGPDLELRRDEVIRTIEAALADPDPAVSEETLAHLANLRHLHLLMVATLRSLRESRGNRPVDLPHGLELPRIDTRIGISVYHTLRELVGRPDRTTFQYATKGTIAVMISFAIASIYSEWRGAPSLLLLSTLVTTANFGALTASFMHRSVGLGLATVIALVSIITVGPSLGDVWISSAFTMLVLFPGALLITNPPTVAAGLNYGMSMMFIFTTFNRLEVDLALVSDRFVAVAGSTLIPWLVFLLFRPTYARDRIGESLGSAIELVADSWRTLSRPGGLTVENDQSRQIAKSISTAAEIAAAMRTEAQADVLADATESMIGKVQMLLILSRDLQFRYRFCGLDRPDPEELEIIEATRHLLASCARSVMKPDESVRLETRTGPIAERIAHLQNRILSSSADGRSGPDPDRLGRLALLESCMGVLRKLEHDARAYRRLLQNRRRIAVGS